MINHLYDVFKKWSYTDGEHKNCIYLYSDTHFSDEEMNAIRKGYIGDEEQVKAINKVVGKNDTLIILGDVGNVEFVKKIHGYKVLILGNHDKGASYYKRGPETYPMTSYTLLDNHLFDEVYEGPLMISDKILLSHEPVDFKYAFNIHGHDHSLWSIPDSMHMNVCAEHLNYKPILLKSIIESGKLKNVPNIHRETIDKAIAKKE